MMHHIAPNESLCVEFEDNTLMYVGMLKIFCGKTAEEKER